MKTLLQKVIRWIRPKSTPPATAKQTVKKAKTKMEILTCGKLYRVEIDTSQSETFRLYDKGVMVFNFKDHDTYQVLWHGLANTILYFAEKKHGNNFGAIRAEIGIQTADILRENPDLRSPDAFKRAIHKHAKG